ncbi:MAG: hypothetical protein PHF14_15430 [Verrucomicrobiota bacterium]|nr:hypothetical protein [Verrucomicrobiota bacterium]
MDTYIPGWSTLSIDTDSDTDPDPDFDPDFDFDFDFDFDIAARGGSQLNATHSPKRQPSYSW